MPQLPHDHGQNARQIMETMPEIGAFQATADIFKQLSDGTRLRLFWILCHCEECVTNLAAMMDMSSPALAHHLRLLKEAQLVTTRREGKEVYYKASQIPASKALHDALEAVMAITCPIE